MFHLHKSGRPVRRQALTDDFSIAAEAAGLPHIPFHGLRHTCASLLLSEGVPIQVVSKVLRHASPAITLRVYTHVQGDELTDWMTKTDGFLDPISEEITERPEPKF